MSSTSDITSKVSKLTLNPSAETPKVPPKTKPKKNVADSWEDEDVSSAESEPEPDSRPSTANDNGDQDGTSAPPPTPITATPGLSQGFSQRQFDDISAISKPRPEKTDAVARRMIAGALGVKVPKQTDEQKAYERAMREKERKRKADLREEEKKRQEDAEKAKAAMWED